MGWLRTETHVPAGRFYRVYGLAAHGSARPSGAFSQGVWIGRTRKRTPQQGVPPGCMGWLCTEAHAPAGRFYRVYGLAAHGKAR
ncbi:MAG: hypothetical protein P8074_01675, partial [Anaerolineales bacterium]